MSEESVAPASSRTVSSQVARAYPLVAGGLFLWLLAWIWLSWPYSLDDALIHLRYADHLLHQHRITYDGVHNSFGTSSLLYVYLLAALRLLWTSPLLPRVVSSIVYALLFLGLAGSLFPRARAVGDEPLSTRLMGMALLAVMVEPSAARWLNDGMETGLVFLDVLFAVWLLFALVRSEQPGTGLILAAFLYGFCTVLLRIELLLLVFCVTCMGLLSTTADAQAARPSVGPRSRQRLVALLPLAGAFLAALLVYATMHALLPDTALAKAYGLADWRSTFQMTAITMGSSFSFGIGLLLLWLGSFLALAVFRGVRILDLCGNMLFPVVLLLAAARGQQIQGIRYFGWTMFFPLMWNLFRCSEDGARRPRQRVDVVLNALTALLLLALIPAAAWESRAFLRLFQGRGSALNAFRAQHLEGLHGQLGMAEDVGFVGYFTQGDLCDPYGLVNGRAAAQRSYQSRFDHCVALHPVFAFGGENFLRRINAEQSLAGWFLCGSYRFDNVRTADVHYLVVSPGHVPQACPGVAQPLSSALPGALQGL